MTNVSPSCQATIRQWRLGWLPAGSFGSVAILANGEQFHFCVCSTTVVSPSFSSLVQSLNLLIIHGKAFHVFDCSELQERLSVDAATST